MNEKLIVDELIVDRRERSAPPSELSTINSQPSTLHAVCWQCRRSFPIDQPGSVHLPAGWEDRVWCDELFTCADCMVRVEEFFENAPAASGLSAINPQLSASA
jgi:hypothetical protein